MKTSFALAGLAAVIATCASANAAPVLSLVQSGTSNVASTSITQGTSALQLDVRLDTGGLDVSGLQFYVDSDPAGTLVYGGTPVTALNAPFTTNDLVPTLSAGDTVQANGTSPILLFKSNGADYPAFGVSSILQLSFDTHLLMPGNYVITPLGDEFTNATVVLESADFAQAQPFTLTVTAAPEPGAVCALSLAGIGLLKRRRDSAQ